MRIEICVVSDDRLSQKVYVFCAVNGSGKPRLYFDIYREESRDSTRKKFRLTGAEWNRLQKRRSTLDERPTIPESIKEEALKEFISMIEFDC